MYNGALKNPIPFKIIAFITCPRLRISCRAISF
jgi:hypothetical protein